jgi:predicted kinase
VDAAAVNTQRVVVITGPIASGKSTVAREVARTLERRGVRTAVVDLDLVHDMLSGGGSASDDATWALARHGVATLTKMFWDEGVAVVIADGSFNTPVDRAALARDLGQAGEPFYVTLRVSYEEALRRAQGDPTRGVSRDPVFLGAHFASRAAIMATIPTTDLVIDTEQTTATSAAKSIVDVVQPVVVRRIPGPGHGTPARNTLQPRLVLLCGLPASGKTTLARELADAYGAVRLNPDEWESALGVDPFDEGFQDRLEAEFWELAQRLLALGTSVVLEWGFWARSDRDEKRGAARTLGVAVELRFLDVPYDELVKRVVARHAAGGIAITETHMERYRATFQPPTDDELALYDAPLPSSAR